MPRRGTSYRGRLPRPRGDHIYRREGQDNLSALVGEFVPHGHDAASGLAGWSCFDDGLQEVESISGLNGPLDLQTLLNAADQRVVALRILHLIEVKKSQHQREDITAAGDHVVKASYLGGRRGPGAGRDRPGPVRRLPSPAQLTVHCAPRS